MTSRVHAPARPWALFHGIAAVWLVAGTAPAVLAEEPSGGPARTALVVFVSWGQNLPTSPDPTRLRQSASRDLATALEETGQTVVPAPAMERLQREWRIRSARDLDPGFLDALVSTFHADELAVTDLAVYRDRVLLLARGLSAETGRLLWVASVEQARSGDASGEAADVLADLEKIAGDAARTLAHASTVRPVASAGATLVVMPLRPVGVERGPSSLALQSLLRSLLATERWAIPDPMLVVSAMQREGYDPLLLDDASRRVLAARFGAEILLVPRLVSFPSTIRATAPPQEVAVELGAPEREWSPEVPMTLSAVIVDGASGRILVGAEQYLAPEKPYRMFGRVNEVSIARHFQTGTDLLIRSLFETQGGGSP